MTAKTRLGLLALSLCLGLCAARAAAQDDQSDDSDDGSQAGQAAPAQIGGDRLMTTDSGGAQEQPDEDPPPNPEEDDNSAALPPLPSRAADCAPGPVPDGGYPRVLDVAVIHKSFESRGALQHGRYLYVSGHLVGRGVGAGLATLDVSDPGRLRLVSTFSGTDWEPNGMAAFGRTLYLAGWNPNSGLQVFDLSVPARPRLVKTLVTPNYSWTATLSYPLLDIGLANETRAGVATYDVSSPQNPKQIWTLEVPERGGLSRPARFGVYLYIGRDDTLWIFDASDPAKPKRVGEYACGRPCGDAAMHDGYLFMNSGGLLRAFDVSSPLHPKPLGALKLDEGGLGEFQGEDLIVPASGSGVYWVDVSDPRNLRLVSNFGVGWPGMGHAGYPISASGGGNYAFIGTTASKTPFSPDSFCTGARVYSVALQGPDAR